MQFIKTRNVKDPVRVVDENAGIDLYIPENELNFRVDLSTKNPKLVIANTGLAAFFSRLFHKTYFRNGVIHVAPHKDIIIPSGIKSKFDKSLALIANNKSGIATKKKFVFGASVIDTSYQGEWHLHMINTSGKYQTLECGQKAIQFIPHVISVEPVEVLNVSESEFYTKKTSRGSGWQGSTGVK
jgi:dUTPase